MKRCGMMILLAATLLVGLSTSIVLAQDAGETAPEGVGVQVTGLNYCLLCALANEEAQAASTGFAKMNALKVTSIQDFDGNAIEGLKGKTLYYLPTKKGIELMRNKASVNKEVTITVGLLFKEQNALLVEEYDAPKDDEADEEEWDEIKTTGGSGVQEL